MIPAGGISSAVVKACVFIGGKPAPDGTPVSFCASGRRIAPRVLTKNGVATAIYRPPKGGKEAVIKAFCQGTKAEFKVKLIEAL